MPRNGSGVFSPPPANYPAVSSTLITAANRNAVDADIATALTNSIAVNGESVITADIPMGNNKITGLKNGTASSDAAAFGQIPTSYNATAIVNTPAGSIAAITVQAAINELDTEKASLSGATFTGDISVPDEAYGVGWNGSLEVPTKNAVYDKIETIGAPPVAASNAEYVTGTDTTKFLNSATARARNIVQGTAIATTSGTSIDFTGIPSWAKRITVMFDGVSTNGTSDLIVQIGDSGGIETAGYLGATGETANTGSGTTLFTTGIGISRGTNTSTVRHGNVVLTNVSTNTWSASVSTSRSDATVAYSGGSSKTLSATLDRVRITTVGGSDTFDAGSINILYE